VHKLIIINIKNMKKTIYLMLLLMIFGTASINAQVTIGANADPATYSVLELVSPTGVNNGQGLRLPQLNITQRNALQVTFTGKATESVGLQIFNTSTRCVETWNGQEWIQACGQDGPPDYALGEVAYGTNNEGTITITGRLQFATYNMGATEMSIKDQLLFESFTGFISNSTLEEEMLTASYNPVYGGLYQWGRKTDGHQNVWSTTEGGEVDEEDWNKDGTSESFRMVSFSWDWLADDSHLDRWGDGTGSVTGTAKGPNDPCPSGFRVPSIGEWHGSIISATAIDAVSSFHFSDNVIYSVNKLVWVDATAGTLLSSLGFTGINQPAKTSGCLIYPPKVLNPTATDEDYYDTPTLFLPAAGNRNFVTAILQSAGVDCGYWSSTVSDHTSFDVFINNTTGVGSNGDNDSRAMGYSVRCLGGVITY
jgi:hypothetical protein